MDLNNSKRLTEELDAKCNMPYENISTLDFSTLYTTIPHKDLIERISKLIVSIFSKTRHRYINVKSHKAFFSSSEYRSYHSWDVSLFIELFEFLIDNINVKFGTSVYQQFIGIPMDTNCAPLLADLYLFYYEYDYVQKLMKTDIRKARSFSFTRRYIDDLLAVNNPYITEAVKEIYPPSLDLTETTDNPNGTSYLDLYLFKTENGLLSRRLYDKRDDFNFDIVNYPFLDSNIPISPAYGVYISRLVAFARSCQLSDDFNQRHKCLIQKLVSQGYSIKRLHSKFLTLGVIICINRDSAGGLWPRGLVPLQSFHVVFF